MDPQFDPDRYLAEKTGSSASFDPDRYLAEKTGGSGEKKSSWLDTELPGGTARGYVKGTLNALPSAGAAAGGLLGGTAGSAAFGIGALPGALAGAGAGGAAGAGLKHLGEKYLLNEDETSSNADRLKDAAKGAGEGLMQEAGGQILGKVTDKIMGDVLSRSSGKFGAPTSPEVEAAAKRLNVKPTQGMLSNNYVEKNLENSISQDPTFAGALVRSDQRPVQEAIGSNVNKMLEGSSSLSPYESGGQMKSDLISGIHQKHDPIQSLYSQIGESTPHIALSAKSQSVVAGNLRRSAGDAFAPGSDGAKAAEQFAQQIEGIKNVDQIAQARSSAGGILRDPNASYGEKQAASMAIDKLDRLNQSSILRSAVSSRGNQVAGENVAQDLIKDIKDARAQYKGLKTNLNTLGEGSGFLSGKGGISQAVNDIESVPNEKMGQSLFKTQNNDFLNFLKESYPEAYESAKGQKLNDIAKASQDPSGEINPKKFMSNIKSLGPEVREHLFGEGSNQKINDMQTLIQSTPAKVGASDTPRGMAFEHILNVPAQAAALGKYGLLKSYPFVRNNPELTSLLQNQTSRGLLKGTQAVTGSNQK